MDFFQSMLANEFGLHPRTLDSFDVVGREREKCLEPLRRYQRNQCPPVDRYEFSASECRNHSDPLVRGIINALRKPGLGKYTLHTGKAFFTHYDGPRFQLKTTREEEVFQLLNKKEGLVLQFRIVEGFSFGSAVYVLFLIRDTDRQGSYHEIKRMLLDELWGQILEPAGFAMICGKAIWSLNSEIRSKSPKSKDWRAISHRVGLNQELEPISVSGIRLLYYRMGFLQLSQFADGFDHDHLGYFSKAVEDQIREALGDADWEELTKFRASENRRWRRIVAEREKELRAVLMELKSGLGNPCFTENAKNKS